MPSLRRCRLICIALAASLVVLGPGCATAIRGGTNATLRVMSYNIQSGSGDLTHTVDAIRALAPDVVALQEVDVHWSDRSNFADQATELGERLGMHVRFARIYQIAAAGAGTAPREFGVALLSKYAIVSWHNDTLTRLSTQEAHPAPTLMPGLLEAVIDVGGLRIRMFNTHLDYRSDPRVRAQQVSEMVDYIGAVATPTIVCGDLNASSDAPELAPLLRAMRDTWPAAAGPGLTYPAESPTKRIDYVLVSPHFRVRSASVPSTTVSDHRPVVVDLEVTRR